jgi:glucose-6-phosphate 1-dehydrogenase
MPGKQTAQRPAGVRVVEAPPRRRARPADPCAMVIFGAGGDLTKRLVAPALYNLARTRMLPKNFALIGVDLAPGTTASWRGHLHDMLKSFVGNAAAEFNIDKIDEAAWRRFAETMSYVRGDLTTPNLYADIGNALKKAGKAHGTRGNVLFYLAVADRFFGTVVEQLGRAKLTDQDQDKNGKKRFWRRVVIEKPFGHSLDSARELNAGILRTLGEDQIFRIDHFLGKETVQNIMAFRFANGLFEPIWNRDRIDHVQITAAETVGVEKRGKFYEATGALRDMVPNHMLTLLSMVAMEPPVGFDAAAIRAKKAEVFAAMPAVDPVQAARGQYAAGTVLGKKVKAYREEYDVAPHSQTETYAALKFEIDNWRWAGVPFYVRTGKHLSRRNTEIAIRFKQAPYAPFQDTPVDALPPNWLVLSIAPDESISLQFEVKRRGPVVDLAAVKMNFRYDEWFPKEPNVGYETLLYDVMIGDATLFMRADMVEQGWRIVQPVLDAWGAEKTAIATYASGSDGPAAADELLKSDGKREWRPVDGRAKPGAATPRPVSQRPRTSSPARRREESSGSKSHGRARKTGRTPRRIGRSGAAPVA